jgi:hypothetical protein
MYRIPSSVLTNASQAVPKVGFDATFANLLALGTFNSIVFPVAFSPLFDIYIFSDVALELQRRTAFSVTGPPGDTFRPVGAPLVNVPNVVTEVVGIRVANFFADWVLTNPGGAPSTILEVVILNRSL